MAARRRRICFVTGTRAEFGLMASTLRAIARRRTLQLQLVVTGMHLDRAHGRSIDAIRRDGWTIDAVVPWPRAATPALSARSTGRAMAGLADAFDRLGSDVVLVAGDRVEAFAAAAAAHVSGRAVAHVHGGDRALGQVDDSLRHAITKLAHVHFPATRQSAGRIRAMGEDPWRIRTFGTPGLDGIFTAEAPEHDRGTFRYALLVYHPATADAMAEERAASIVLRATRAVGFDGIVIVAPNNDPGAAGVLRCWDAAAAAAGEGGRLIVRRDLPRPQYLALLRNAAVLVGNSSSGIIEAASFGTPVVDVGPRQAGRERSDNVIHVPLAQNRIRAALAEIWRDGRPVRFRGKNVYGSGGAGELIAAALTRLSINDRLLRKLIAY